MTSYPKIRLLLSLLLFPLLLFAEGERVTTVVDNHPGGTIEVEQLTEFAFRLTAVPADGYVFLRWSDGYTNTVRQHNHTADFNADVAYYAVFMREEDMTRPYGTLSVSRITDGSVSTPPSFRLLASAEQNASFYIWNNGVHEVQGTDYTGRTNAIIDYVETDGRRYPFFTSSIPALVVGYEQHAGGSVAAELTDGLTYSLTATPQSGYTFLKWADGNTDNPRSYTHDPDVQDAALYAVFTRDEYMTRPLGAVSASIVDAGSVSAFPTYSLTATAATAEDANARFYIWNNGNTTGQNTASTSLAYSESDGARYPFFISTTPALIVGLEQHPGGVISAEHTAGLTYSLTATPQSGYTFLKWADGSTDNPRAYTHDPLVQDAALYAVFTRDEYMTRPLGSVSASVADAGSVSAFPTYSLTATAATAEDANATFYLWNNGDATGQNTTSSVLAYSESDGARYPFFISTSASLVLNLEQHPGGVITASHVSGLRYTLTATPNEGYTFLRWADDASAPAVRTYEHNPAVQDAALYAVFTRDEYMTRPLGSVAASVADAGSVSAFPTYSLTATAATAQDANATFYLWNNGDATGQNTASSVLAYSESDGARYPFFISTSASLVVNYEQHPGGVVSAQHVSGTTYTLTATPNSGYTFLQWADGNLNSTRSYTHSTSVPEAAFYAVFTRDEHLNPTGGTIAASVSDAGSLTAFPSYSLSVSPTATGPCASSFYLWNNGTNDNPLAYSELDGPRRAFFVRTNAVAYDNEDGEGGTIQVTEFDCGFTLTAVPAGDYAFAYWDDDHTNTNPVRTPIAYSAPQEFRAVFSKSAFRVGSSFYQDFPSAETAAASQGLPVELSSDVAGNVDVTRDIQLSGNGYTLANLTIRCGARVDLTTALRVNNLYLHATTGSSAQLKNQMRLTCTNAYIDITLEAGKAVASPDKWYAISVPFEVDVELGIARANGLGSHQNQTDYLVWSYDGDLRARTGNGWEIMYSGNLLPGRFYMIGIDGNCNTWRFTKRAGAALGGDIAVPLEQFATADPSNVIDCGWNAMGNSTLRYARADIAGIPYVQVYQNGYTRYMPKMLDETTFVVAAPFFVQTSSDNTLYLSASDETNPAALYAPTHRALSDDEQALDNEVYQVRFTDGTDDSDALFLTARSDAEDRYVIGRDLVKLIGASTNPYIYTMAYGQMLCARDIPLVDDAADCPLILYAPVAGEYRISANDGYRDLWLMHRGVPLTLLNGASYTLRLNKGATRDYALRLGTPRPVATDLPEASDGNDEITPFKFIDNGILYIIRNGLQYDATGRLVQR